MADNITLNPGSGGDVIGSDDIGGVKFQRVKLIHGADGTNDGDVASGNPLPVGGNVAHDAADAGNPLPMGAHAVSMAVAPPQVSADDDRVRLAATPWGALWTLAGHPAIQTAEYNTTGAQTNDDILGAVAAGSFVVVTEIEALVHAATTVNVAVRIGFGASAVPTEAASGSSVAGVVLSHPGIAPGSGVVRGNGAGVLGVGASGEELRITNGAPTTGKLTVLVSYYVASL